MPPHVPTPDDLHMSVVCKKCGSPFDNEDAKPVIVADCGHVVCERCADAYETTRTILPDENPWMCPSCRCTTGTRRRVYLCDGMGRDDLPQSDVFVSGLPQMLPVRCDLRRAQNEEEVASLRFSVMDEQCRDMKQQHENVDKDVKEVTKLRAIARARRRKLRADIAAIRAKRATLEQLRSMLKER